jgi:predicted NAD/FAD-dependent oxidoreductase
MTRGIAVIGAGVAGAFAARGLAEAGEPVTVFDKGRSIGGRLAQRRREGAVFDHGAQFIRPTDPLLVQLMEAGVEAGVVARWPAAEVDERRAYVGTPGMATPLKQLLAEVPVETNCRIARLARDGEGWWLDDAGGNRHGPFTFVVIAIPPVQAKELLASIEGGAPTVLQAAVEKARLAPCWALLMAFDPPLELEGFDARSVDGGPISWLARNTSKPGRAGRDAWTVHASPAWSIEHLEETPEVVAPLLLEAFRAVTGVGDVEPCYIEAHRWRYALVTEPVSEAALFDRGSGLGICGDWCLGGKVEAAFLSGRALVKLVQESA